MEANHGLQEGLPYWDLSLTHPIQHLIMANMIRNILRGQQKWINELSSKCLETYRDMSSMSCLVFA